MRSGLGDRRGIQKKRRRSEEPADYGPPRQEGRSTERRGTSRPGVLTPIVQGLYAHKGGTCSPQDANIFQVIARLEEAKSFLNFPACQTQYVPANFLEKTTHAGSIICLNSGRKKGESPVRIILTWVKASAKNLLNIRFNERVLLVQGDPVE